MSRLCSDALAEVGRVLLARVGAIAARGEGPRTLLDVGCWDGEATARYAALLGGPARGIEIFDAPAAAARRRGVEVAQLDLESDPFPWPDHSADVVVCNQVFEHLKNVWLPMAEIFRVLRPGGTLLLSVPNLASLHNRVLLVLGRQPTSIRTLGPHVRGYTLGEIRAFVALGDAFPVTRAIGVAFYPFPARLARGLCTLWPAGSHTSVIEAVRGEAGTPPWREWIEAQRGAGLQTRYPEAASTADRARHAP